MPNYTIPGVHTDRRTARVLGALAVAIVVAAGVAWQTYTDRAPRESISVRLRTEQIGEGIVDGTAVRYDGVAIGRITAVDPIEQGRQVLTLELDEGQTAGLTETLSVDYAPENLFGVSAVALRSAPGGAPLRDGQMIDLAGRVSDVTMGALLRSLTETATEVLTPKLTELLTQFNGDLRAFTPMLEAVITMSRLVADTQRYPSSFLLDQYAGFFNGFGAFTSATFKLAKAIMDIEIFVNERDRYDASITMIRNSVLGGLTDTLNTAGGHFGGLTDALTPTIEALAATLPDPPTSHAQLTELIERLNRIFVDTPNGPTVNVEVTLRGIPGVAVPLFGQQAFTELTAPQLEGVR